MTEMTARAARAGAFFGRCHHAGHYVALKLITLGNILFLYRLYVRGQFRPNPDDVPHLWGHISNRDQLRLLHYFALDSLL